MPTDSVLTQWQRDANEMSAGMWPHAAGHRARVTQLLTAAAGARSEQRLAVLGAGNCNDLVLAELLETYTEITLIDLDGTALSRGAAAQGLRGDARLTLVDGFDVSGVLDEVERYRAAGPDAGRLDALVEAARSAEVARPASITDEPGGSAGFDIVASTCLLSQICLGVHRVLGDNSAASFRLIEALRLRHLRLLVEWLKPGGRGVLVTDFVSSQTVPNLKSIPAEALPKTLLELIKQKNFFTGLNPFSLQKLFLDDPWLAENTADMQCTLPWVWDMGTRQYAVVAITFTRC